MPKAPPVFMKVERKPWRTSMKTRHERGYGSKWDKLRLIALKRDKHLCQPCLRQSRYTPAKTVDHIRSKANGGSDDLTNLQAICSPCHAEKTARESDEARGDPHSYPGGS